MAGIWTSVLGYSVTLAAPTAISMSIPGHLLVGHGDTKELIAHQEAVNLVRCD